MKKILIFLNNNLDLVAIIGILFLVWMYASINLSASGMETIDTSNDAEYVENVEFTTITSSYTVGVPECGALEVECFYHDEYLWEDISYRDTLKLSYDDDGSCYAYNEADATYSQCVVLPEELASMYEVGDEVIMQMENGDIVEGMVIDFQAAEHGGNKCINMVGGEMAVYYSGMSVQLMEVE